MITRVLEFHLQALTGCVIENGKDPQRCNDKSRRNLTIHTLHFAFGKPGYHTIIDSDLVDDCHGLIVLRLCDRCYIVSANQFSGEPVASFPMAAPK